MGQENPKTEKVLLNTDYKKQTGVECTIMRLNATPNARQSYAYALIKGELPKDAKVYGKEGRVIFYSNKLVGGHMQNHVCNLAVVANTNPNTGEVTQRVLIMRTDAEIKAAESQQRETRELLREAAQFGLTKQEVGKQLFAAKFAAKFGVSAQQVETGSEE